MAVESEHEKTYSQGCSEFPIKGEEMNIKNRIKRGDDDEVWGMGKLVVKSVGDWPKNSWDDIKNATRLLQEHGFFPEIFDLGASSAIIKSLDGLFPNTAITYRQFFERNHIVFCYVLDGLPKRSALVSAAKWKGSSMRGRPMSIVCEITDIDRWFRKINPEFMADMKILADGAIELKTGINPDDLKGVELAQHK